MKSISYVSFFFKNIGDWSSCTKHILGAMKYGIHGLKLCPLLPNFIFYVRGITIKLAKQFKENCWNTNNQSLHL